MSCSDKKSIIIIGCGNAGIGKTVANQIEMIKQMERGKTIVIAKPPSNGPTQSMEQANEKFKELQEAFKQFAEAEEKLSMETLKISEVKHQEYFYPKKVHPKHQKQNKYRK